VQIRKALFELAPDGLMLAGMGAISYGAAQVYSPAGWIVAGGFALGFGWLAARRNS
jgi:hypothetical protein